MREETWLKLEDKWPRMTRWVIDNPRWWCYSLYERYLDIKFRFFPCKHPNMEVGTCYPEDGGEELYCPDCGFSKTCWF